MQQRAILLSGLFLSLFCLLIFPISSARAGDLSLGTHGLNSTELLIEIPGLTDGLHAIQVNGSADTLLFNAGNAVFVPSEDQLKLCLFQYDGDIELYHISQNDNGGLTARHIPLWLSILPPLIAIALALILKEVLISLFAGIWVGAFIANGMTLDRLFTSLLDIADTYAINVLSDSGHLSVIIFSLLIGGMVAIISRNGGMMGIVNALSRYARTARSAQFITWLMGILIFFDDYANTLIVGNTMRPVTDRFKVSREKLAYIVDSTAAPVAAIAFVTTWIGAELGYIGSAIDHLGLDENAYMMFLGSLRYSFYPVFTLFFMFALIYTGRDFGSMLAVEKRARTEGTLASETPADEGREAEELKAMEPKNGIKARWYNAFFPVLVVVLVTLIGLLVTGYDSSTWADGSMGWLKKISTTIGNADSYKALLWSSLCGVLTALILTWAGRIMKLGESMNTMLSGFKSLMPAVLILVSAWMLAQLTEELHTATFLTDLLLGNIHPYWMPALVFVLAAAISFSTGSSWGTMAILYPLAMPTTWAICQSSGLPHDAAMDVMHNVISVVLAGSVFGDHCSPISDTTILSSLASGCNHIAHVRTQLPYAITVGVISIFTGGVLFFIGSPWWLSFIVGFILLWLLVKVLGKKVPEPAA